MNSKFTLPMIVSNGNNNTAVRVKPQTVGPDNMTVFTTNELYIEVVVSSTEGLVFDASAGTIEFTRAELKEANLGGTTIRRGVHILAPGSGRVIRGNEISVLRTNAQGNSNAEVLRIESSSSIYKNRFELNNADEEGVNITDLNTPSKNTIVYPNFPAVSSSAPAAADCNNDAERGRQVIVTGTNRLYVCNGATRGWDYVALTN